MESGVQIRKSLGMIRGKTDKIDSERIAQYAYTHKHKVNIWQAPRAVIKNISTLLAQRSRLIKCKKQLSVPINEQQDCIDKPIAKQLAYSTAKVVASLDKQLQVTETQIMKIVKSDDNINRLYKIITSVDGIGFVTAMYIITTTNEFIYIDNAKKYACYSGVVPFEHSSATSISTKHRVSPMANKGIKTLLHLAALSAMQSNEELKQYYQRKLAAGKNKMRVINAIRNKLILSIFACVQNNRTFEKNYTYPLGYGLKALI